MIAAEDEEVLWVLDLVCQEEADGLERLLTPIDVVTEEKVVCFRREPTILEEAQQVVVLSVDITTDLSKWSVNLKQEALHGAQNKAGYGRMCLAERAPLKTNVKTYLYRSFELEQNGLRNEDFTSLGAEIANLRLEELNLLSRPASTHFQESINDGI